MVDGVQMTAAEYISSMGRKLATALMNAAHDEDGHVISDSKITFLIEKMLNQVRQQCCASPCPLCMVRKRGRKVCARMPRLPPLACAVAATK